MEISLQTLLIVCPLVFLAGFVDSVAGGGGLISLPAYYLAGLPPVMAAGTNKLSACLGTAASTVRFVRGHKVVWQVGLLAALGAFPGSFLGTRLLMHIPEETLRLLMIVAIPLVACVVLRRRKEVMGWRIVPAPWVKPLAFAIGLVVGFYDGLVGPGTGTFLILLFTMILGLEGVLASGTAKIVNLSSNVVSLLSLLASGQVAVALGLAAAVCGIAGNWLGAGMTMKRGTGFIRTMMLIVLVLLLAKMVWDML